MINTTLTQIPIEAQIVIIHFIGNDKDRLALSSVNKLFFTKIVGKEYYWNQLCIHYPLLKNKNFRFEIFHELHVALQHRFSKVTYLCMNNPTFLPSLFCFKKSISVIKHSFKDIDNTLKFQSEMICDKINQTTKSIKNRQKKYDKVFKEWSEFKSHGDTIYLDYDLIYNKFIELKLKPSETRKAFLRILNSSNPEARGHLF